MIKVNLLTRRICLWAGWEVCRWAGAERAAAGRRRLPHPPLSPPPPRPPAPSASWRPLPLARGKAARARG